MENKKEQKSYAEKAEKIDKIINEYNKKYQKEKENGYYTSCMMNDPFLF